MLATKAYPSRYMKAADLISGKKRRKAFIILDAQMESLGEEEKPVVLFEGEAKGLVCNKTNWNTLTELFGVETDDWSGNKVVLMATKVDFQGKSVDGIRVDFDATQDLASAEEDPIQMNH